MHASDNDRPLQVMEDICHQILDLYSDTKAGKSYSEPSSAQPGNSSNNTPPNPPSTSTSTPAKRSRSDHHGNSSTSSSADRPKPSKLHSASDTAPVTTLKQIQSNPVG